MTMVNLFTQWRSILPAGQQWVADTRATVLKNNLWQIMLKNGLSTAIAIAIGVIPQIVAVHGHSTFYGAMATAFGQPGRRFGQMTETVSLIGIGSLLGVGWGDFGLWLSSLVDESNVNASWAIRAVIFFLGVVVHGLVRSAAPRLFHLLFFFTLVNLGILTAATKDVILAAATSVIYPVFTAIGVMIVINVTIYPQFSSGFLGKTTIETLGEAVNSVLATGDWFLSDMTAISPSDPDQTPREALSARLAALSGKKESLRSCLGSCKAVQSECNFELVYAVLPPRSLKPISVTMMARLVQITICLINACEGKFALADSELDTSGGEESEEKGKRAKPSPGPKTSPKATKHIWRLDSIKPIRQIESGDLDLLEHVMSPIRQPVRALQEDMKEAVDLVMSALAYCYDVPHLPSGSVAPDGLMLEEIDIRTERFTLALQQFNLESAEALKRASATTYGKNLFGDITPRIETHLVSSFLINFGQAAGKVLEMLKHARVLVERRQHRNGRRRLYWPRISWIKWLTTGGELDGNMLPENARKEVRAGYGLTEDDNSNTSTEVLTEPKRDEEAGDTHHIQPTVSDRGKIPRRKGPSKSTSSNALWLRGLIADTVEFLLDSGDLGFALKMTIATLLLTTYSLHLSWPAFVPSFNPWYVSVRGSWATFQLILVFEVSIGTSFQAFFLRALGTIIGCSIGIVAFEIGQGNLAVLIIVLAIGLIPANYLNSATRYNKAGVITIISLAVVGISTVVPVNQDPPWLTYAKRMVCFLIGGIVAVVVEMILFPVRARDRLVESLASSIKQISIMEASVAAGVDSAENVDIKSLALNASFTNAKEKAEQALSAAQTFLPFCLSEPRIKGNFKGQTLVYGEMIHVLFQIMDRMENMQHIRKLYGSSVLEELHAEVMPYRRNVAGCITLSLFAVDEALTTRLPLPQFLPSSRVAQLRYVARVRELLLDRKEQVSKDEMDARLSTVPQQRPLDNETMMSMTRQNFLAWNASSAGMMEIIEYLEELVDLAKLLVGVNAFRSGMLERPRFHEYLAKTKMRDSDGVLAKPKMS
ncbi:hypothetical protein F5Y16DRAFT_410262 [Xylariaceae sp. FL0255]|nr:hypothetical protein F5Y16DRAFT_410262 [Xylariaceae sp. FL0255]